LSSGHGRPSNQPRTYRDGRPCDPFRLSFCWCVGCRGRPRLVDGWHHVGAMTFFSRDQRSFPPITLFAWLVSHQPQNKSATNQQLINSTFLSEQAKRTDDCGARACKSRPRSLGWDLGLQWVCVDVGDRRTKGNQRRSIGFDNRPWLTKQTWY
jgi:hypothetical protein